MNPNELRIGSWMYFMASTSQCFERQMTANSFFKLGDSTINGRNPLDYFDIKPIPLNAIFLEKRAGFIIGAPCQKGKEGRYCSKGIFKVWLSNNGEIRVDQCGRIVKFIHDLQNGYRWHTGKELEIIDDESESV